MSPGPAGRARAGSLAKAMGRPLPGPSSVAAASFLVAVLVAASLPARGQGQYIYLDSDGDGVNTAADVLNEIGTPTTVSIWLDTSRNADSTPAVSPKCPEPLSLLSYEIVLQASGGAVAYGKFANARSGMRKTRGTAANGTDFHAAFGGSAKLSPGSCRLGTIVVTVVSGSPGLSFATSTPLGARYTTSFSTACPGKKGATTRELGWDWHGMAVCGPPGGGQVAPAAVAPARVAFRKGAPVHVIAEFVDFNTSDSLAVGVEGLPPGLVAVAGTQREGRRQMRAYGFLADSVPAGASYEIIWTASDGLMARQARTDLRALEPEPVTAEFEEHVVQVATRGYIHGLPRLEARAVGSPGLPILAGLLREGAYWGKWHSVAATIGFIGSPAYFDTLRDFIWARFQGAIDFPTFQAIRQAQSALGAMATISPQVREYLEATSNPEAWDALPWTSRADSRQAVSTMMAKMTITSISYTDSEWAAALLARIQQTTHNPGLAEAAAYGNWLNGEIRAGGYVELWAREDNSFGGYGWRKYGREHPRILVR